MQGTYVQEYTSYTIDGTEIHRITAKNTTRFDTGFLSPTQLTPDDPHTIDVRYNTDNSGGLFMGALAIVYGP